VKKRLARLEAGEPLIQKRGRKHKQLTGPIPFPRIAAGDGAPEEIAPREGEGGLESEQTPCTSPALPVVMPLFALDHRYGIGLLRRLHEKNTVAPLADNRMHFCRMLQAADTGGAAAEGASNSVSK
jgi:hypothetical protein